MSVRHRPVAWITGAGSGLGRSVALRLVADNYVIAATSRSQRDLAELAAEPSARSMIHAYAGDVTDRIAMVFNPYVFCACGPARNLSIHGKIAVR